MIELKHICAGYGEHKVLQDFNASFADGELTAVVGTNGCGKTTLLKTVVGILPHTQGEILADGCSAEKLTPRESARHIAYLPQSRGVPQMTVEQLVLHGRFAHLGFPRVYSEADREIAIAAMRKMGLEQLSAVMLDTLSGGMRQKAYLAMALAQNSNNLLLDEPTVYLDIAHQNELMRALREIAREGRAVVAVLHDLTLAMEFADKVAVIDGGALLQKDTPEEIFSSGVVNRVFGVSLGRIETASGYSYFYIRE